MVAFMYLLRQCFLYNSHIHEIAVFCFFQLDVDIATHILVKEDGPKRRYVDFT